MPKLPEFLADAKITPSALGASAFETAGRRLGPLSDQIAEGQMRLGKSIAQLWDEAKFGLEKPTGGGAGLRGGNVHDALDFGGRQGNGNPMAILNRGDNLPGQSVPYAGPNIQAQREISSAAASLATLTTKLSLGQGLTGSEWMALNAEEAKQQQRKGWWDTKLEKWVNPGGSLGLSNEVKPTAEPSGEEAAKALFKVSGEPVDYTKNVPGWPYKSKLREAYQTAASPAPTPDAPPGLGTRIYNFITGAGNSSTTNAANATDAEAGTDNSNAGDIPSGGSTGEIIPAQENSAVSGPGSAAGDEDTNAMH